MVIDVISLNLFNQRPLRTRIAADDELKGVVLSFFSCTNAVLRYLSVHTSISKKFYIGVTRLLSSRTLVLITNLENKQLKLAKPFCCRWEKKDLERGKVGSHYCCVSSAVRKMELEPVPTTSSTSFCSMLTGVFNGETQSDT